MKPLRGADAMALLLHLKVLWDLDEQRCELLPGIQVPGSLCSQYLDD